MPTAGSDILAMVFGDAVMTVARSEDMTCAFFPAEIVMFEGGYNVRLSQQRRPLLLLIVDSRECFNWSLRFNQSAIAKNVEKAALLDNLDGIMLIEDKIVDQGIVLESDPNTITQRTAMKLDDIPLSEQSVAQVGKHVLQTAKDQLKWSLLR
ncbi:probable coatomer subunit zeta isoform X6 [Oscarella lobularis]